MIKRNVFIMLICLLMSTSAFATEMEYIPTSAEEAVVVEAQAIVIPTYEFVENDKGNLQIKYTDTNEIETLVDSTQKYKSIAESDTLYQYRNFRDLEKTKDGHFITFMCDYTYEDYTKGDLKDKYVIYNMATHEFSRLRFDYKLAKIPYFIVPVTLNITEEDQLVMKKTHESYEKKNFLLFTLDGRLISQVVSLDDLTHIENIYYDSIGFGKNFSETKSTRYFNLYDENKMSKIRLKEDVHINANGKTSDVETHRRPFILAAYSDGELIKNPTESTYRASFTFTELTNRSSKGGIIFGVNPKMKKAKNLSGFGIFANPTTMKVEVVEFKNGNEQIIRSFDYLEHGTEAGQVDIYAALIPMHGKVIMDLSANGNVLIDNMYIGDTRDVPAWSSFGISSSDASVVYDRYNAYGTMTVPREK